MTPDLGAQKSGKIGAKFGTIREKTRKIRTTDDSRETSKPARVGPDVVSRARPERQREVREEPDWQTLFETRGLGFP